MNTDAVLLEMSFEILVVLPFRIVEEHDIVHIVTSYMQRFKSRYCCTDSSQLTVAHKNGWASEMTIEVRLQRTQGSRRQDSSSGLYDGIAAANTTGMTYCLPQLLADGRRFWHRLSQVRDSSTAQNFSTHFFSRCNVRALGFRILDDTFDHYPVDISLDPRMVVIFGRTSRDRFHVHYVVRLLDALLQSSTDQGRNDAFPNICIGTKDLPYLEITEQHLTTALQDFELAPLPPLRRKEGTPENGLLRTASSASKPSQPCQDSNTAI